MKHLFFILLILLTTTAHAGIMSVGYGLGAGHQVTPLSSQKIFNLTYSAPIASALHYQFEVGFYNDSVRGIPFVGHSFFQIGARIKPVPFMYFCNYFGPGGISRRDDLLGSHFQWSIDLCGGWEDPNTGVSLGLRIKHISNAGFVQPNQGRNFYMLQAGWPL